MKANLKDCLAQRDLYHSNLAALEIRLDRLQSRTVQSVYGRATSPTPAKVEEEVDKEEVDIKEEERRSSSPAVSG